MIRLLYNTLLFLALALPINGIAQSLEITKAFKMNEFSTVLTTYKNEFGYKIKTSRQYTSIDLDIKVKRCVVSGTQGYIDLVFTNNTGKHMSNEKDTCVRFLNGEMSYYEKIMENIFGVC